MVSSLRWGEDRIEAKGEESLTSSSVFVVAAVPQLPEGAVAGRLTAGIKPWS